MPGPHLQTIVPARMLQVAAVAYQRERWDTPDGDFIDVDFALPQQAAADVPVVVLFHGLEGDSGAHYARLVMQGCAQRGWRGLVVHFRGCSGEPNRLPRAYHSGDSAEVHWVLARVAARWPRARRFAVGVSLGGNALAKWAGERADAAAALVDACVTVSAPFDLAAGGAALGRGFNRVYTYHFLRTLRRKALAMVVRFPGLADPRRIAASRSLFAFDDAFTAPVHGFAGALDYWQRAAARPWLRAVRVPLLALNAANDPFVPLASLPTPGELSPAITLEVPRAGGHVGFFYAAPGADPWYLRDRVVAFLATHL